LNTLKRAIGPLKVNPIGLGCMNLNHGYGPYPNAEDAQRFLLNSLDAGYDFFDTAALYGGGQNEVLLGNALAKHRSRFTLASKCGMTLERNNSGKLERVIDGRPATLRATCELALRSLKTDVIDLYYLHRQDKTIPIEESVGALSELVRSGKIRAIGLSEMSAGMLRRADAVHPIAAMQTEYSLWTRNPEIAVLQACEELGTAFVAFSPLARAFLCDRNLNIEEFAPQDLRRTMPRFQPEVVNKLNQQLMPQYRAIANEVGCKPAQLALAWVLKKSSTILAIPGTTNFAHAQQNLAALTVNLSDAQFATLDNLINEKTVPYPRYTPAAQSDVSTEEFS
jgi:aryl-alcohol dehydrogenase-like predicted oxidoreductase